MLTTRLIFSDVKVSSLSRGRLRSRGNFSDAEGRQPTRSSAQRVSLIAIMLFRPDTTTGGEEVRAANMILRADSARTRLTGRAVGSEFVFSCNCLSNIELRFILIFADLYCFHRGWS